MLSLLEAGENARAVLIAGPTASGKSALALELAEAADKRGRPALIVNCDAMQVYDGLRVLTARPSPLEEQRVPHRLYGHVAAATRFSVGGWIRDVQPVVLEARTTGALLVVVGGTGLYFKAATEGLVATPEIPDAVRRKWTECLVLEGAAALHSHLSSADPEGAAAIRPGDASRVVRALEVLEGTGRPLRAWRAEAAVAPLLPTAAGPRFVIEPERDALYRRIEARFDSMVERGALEEVDALIARGLPQELPVMKAIGVREFTSVLRQEIALADAVETAKRETRRYAKRQMTWFRNQFANWQRLGN
jgi:tRNA dimethylallyltransferase